MNRTTCEHFTPIDLHCDHCADQHSKQPLKTMTEQERELDLLVAELEQENRLLRARNQRLEKELAAICPPPAECMTKAEMTAFAFGWWKAMEQAKGSDSEGGEHD